MSGVTTSSEALSLFIRCWPCPKCGVVSEVNRCTAECSEQIGYCDACDWFFLIKETDKRKFQWPQGE